MDSPPSSVRVAWTAPPPNPKLPSLDQSRILVTADGHTGYYLCWGPAGETSATLAIDMKRPSYQSNLTAGEPVPRGTDGPTCLGAW